MKCLKIILFLLVGVHGMAQTVYQELFKFETFYEPFDYDPVPCPWQSWRLAGHVSMSIDLICDDEALAVLQKEPWLFKDDLMTIYHGYPNTYESCELIRRWSNNPKKYRVQIPGLTAPYERYWIPVDPHNALDLSKNPYFGWYYRILPGNIPIAIKKLPSGEWHVSSALLLRPVDPR